MRGTLIKLIVSVVVVGGAVSYLLASSAGQAFEYYKHVDEVVPDVAAWQKKPLQLHGFVLPGSIKKRMDRDTGRLEYKFTVTNCGKEMEAMYAGVVPDTFKDGAEVVVKGTLDGSAFHSTEVMAKCPSKYQATGGDNAVNTMCARGRAN
jgi:cytochrome c-type biogenesis protein CcmE